MIQSLNEEIVEKENKEEKEEEEEDKKYEYDEEYIIDSSYKGPVYQSQPYSGIYYSTIKRKIINCYLKSFLLMTRTMICRINYFLSKLDA